MSDEKLTKSFELLEGYSKFYLIGDSLHTLLIQKKITTQMFDQFTPETKKLLTLLQDSPGQKNVFSYLLQCTAWGGIFSVTRELIEQYERYEQFARGIFGEEYEAFEQIIRFLRNVFSHASLSTLQIKKDDFLKQKQYLQFHKKLQLLVHLPPLGGEDFFSDGEKHTIAVDFSQLKEGLPLHQILSSAQQNALALVCVRLAQAFRKAHG